MAAAPRPVLVVPVQVRGAQLPPRAAAAVLQQLPHGADRRTRLPSALPRPALLRPGSTARPRQPALHVHRLDDQDRLPAERPRPGHRRPAAARVHLQRAGHRPADPHPRPGQPGQPAAGPGQRDVPVGRPGRGRAVRDTQRRRRRLVLQTQPQRRQPDHPAGRHAGRAGPVRTGGDRVRAAVPRRPVPGPATRPSGQRPPGCRRPGRPRPRVLSADGRRRLRTAAAVRRPAGARLVGPERHVHRRDRRRPGRHPDDGGRAVHLLRVSGRERGLRHGAVGAARLGRGTGTERRARRRHADHLHRRHVGRRPDRHRRASATERPATGRTPAKVTSAPR